METPIYFKFDRFNIISNCIPPKKQSLIKNESFTYATEIYEDSVFIKSFLYKVEAYNLFNQLAEIGLT